MEHGFTTLEDLHLDNMKEKDITDLSLMLARSAKAATQVTFGISRLKGVISVMHWAQDQQRVGLNPIVVNLTSQDEFLKKIQRSYVRSNARGFQEEEWARTAETSDPGKLKNDDSVKQICI